MSVISLPSYCLFWGWLKLVSQLFLQPVPREFPFHALPVVGVLQGGHQSLRAAVLGPVWQADGHGSAGVGICIAVEGNVHSAVTGVFDQFQIIQMAAHSSGALSVVGKVHRTIATPADFQCFFPRGQQAVGPQAGSGVGVVVAAHAGRHSGQFG